MLTQEKIARKTEAEVRALTQPRLKAYIRSVQERVARQVPWCCEFHCEETWDGENEKEQHESDRRYVHFLKAIYKSRSVIKGTSTKATK